MGFATAFLSTFVPGVIFNRRTPCDTMRIEPTSGPTFGYSNKLKTLYKLGKLPIKYGFYGDILSTKNVSLEHLQPKSKGGKSTLSNYVLASKRNNTLRGNDDLSEHFNPEAAERYLNQFINIKAKGFDGNEYIKMILKTIETLLNKQ